MEVGAVKQAFNNDVIHLKKKLNQAKVQIIHKLTRKAKTLTEKKSPEHMKEKLKKKAESAVNEVLLIKKIKSKDIAKFMITHTGELKDYLNKPKVDNDKACARLILHKALQDKYKYIRNRFGNVPIKDLFMGRQERRKLKKEARELQKNKKKGKDSKVVNAVGDWDVEDVKVEDDISLNGIGSDNEVSNNEDSDKTSEHSDKEDNMESADDESEANEEADIEMESDNSEDNQSNASSNAEVDKDCKDFDKEETEPFKEPELPINKIDKNKSLDKTEITEPVLKVKKLPNKKMKENKNKNLKDKLQNRKFKKDDNESQMSERKVVDPFFITATGESYLSLAEPRQHDEIKEIHKRGNRRERRAVMFGHVPNVKPRRTNVRQDHYKDNEFQRSNDHEPNLRNNNGRFNDNGSKYERNDNFRRNNKFSDNLSDRNNKLNNKDNNIEHVQKEVKLHPSWEAKKKLSSILPFQGKKTVFNES